jgi:hypothetical protein
VVGQRTELAVLSDHVIVRYVAEVPRARLYAELFEDTRRGGAEDTFVKRRIAEIADGVTVLWDGQPLPSARTDVRESAEAGEPGFLDLVIEKSAALPGQHGTLGLRIANWPDEEGGYFATSVKVGGEFVVTASSLARVLDGRLTDNRHGAWVRDPSAREESVTVRPAGWLERKTGVYPMTERLEGMPGVHPEPWVLGLAVASFVPIAWAGRALGTRVRRARDAERGAEHA